VLGVEVQVAHEGHTEEYIQFHTVDRSMLERFGIKPSTTFETGVRRLHEFLIKEGRDAGQPA
jgi:hypothetical protein